MNEHQAGMNFVARTTKKTFMRSYKVYLGLFWGTKFLLAPSLHHWITVSYNYWIIIYMNYKLCRLAKCECIFTQYMKISSEIPWNSQLPSFGSQTLLPPFDPWLGCNLPLTSHSYGPEFGVKISYSICRTQSWKIGLGKKLQLCVF